MGREGRVRGSEGAEEGEGLEKVEGGLHLDICPGTPPPAEFLVTPLCSAHFS